MSTELYLPPTYATVDERSVFYVESIDNPQLAAKRKRESEKMKRYWSDKRHRRRIDKSQAKPVDVFTMEGDLVATYPSSRKAAIALFGEENYRSHERNIRACRRMDKNKKSHLGYQFRDHVDGVTHIEPYTKGHHAAGYHYTKTRTAYASRRIASVCEFGIRAEWDSVKECAQSLGVTYGAVWQAMHDDRQIKGHKLQYLTKRQLNK